jgi:hypothetical protein
VFATTFRITCSREARAATMVGHSALSSKFMTTDAGRSASPARCWCAHIYRQQLGKLKDAQTR